MGKGGVKEKGKEEKEEEEGQEGGGWRCRFRKLAWCEKQMYSPEIKLQIDEVLSELLFDMISSN